MKTEGNRMKRIEKYPETETFHYHNQNPHNRITGDCVYRAISYATRIPYNDIVLEIAYRQIETGYCKDDKRTFESILTKYGFVKMPQPKHKNGKKFTMKDFVETYGIGLYVVQLKYHLTVVENGKNIDIWDCVKHGGCVGNYYVKVR
jgi:hypothetical protein